MSERGERDVLAEWEEWRTGALPQPWQAVEIASRLATELRAARNEQGGGMTTGHGPTPEGMTKREKADSLRAQAAEIEREIGREWAADADTIERARGGEFGPAQACPSCGNVLVWHKSGPAGDILGDRWEHWVQAGCYAGQDLPAPRCRCRCNVCGGVHG